MLAYTNIVTFAEYITKKFTDWRDDKTGNEGSAARFAEDVLKITPQLLSEWMNRGKVPTDPKNIEKLAMVFRNDIKNLHEALGSPNQIMLLSPTQLPSIFASSLEAALLELAIAYKNKGIKDKDSPEAIKLAEDILFKHGLSIDTNTNTLGTR